MSISNMPSFDVVSEVDKMEVKNAVDQSLRELSTRFDFKGTNVQIHLEPKSGSIILSTDNQEKLKPLRDLVTSKLAKRNIDLRNIIFKDPDISPLGHSKQELAIQQGIEGNQAKQIIQFIKSLGLKIQAAIQDRHVRVSGAKKDDLQKVIASLRSQDFGISLAFKNFRD